MFIGCWGSSPEEVIAQIRAEYTIELNSWSADSPPGGMASNKASEVTSAVAGEAAAVSAEASAVAEAASEESTGYDEEEMVSGPQPTDVLFDLVVFFRGRRSWSL